MARYCDACGSPTQPHDPRCFHCGAELLKGEEAESARKRWEGLSEATRREFQTQHDDRVRKWQEAREFYERKAPIKHMFSTALVFGVVGGVFSGVMALAYALAGLLAGRILSRRKGGLFLGTVVGAAVFVLVLGVRTVISFIFPGEGVSALLSAAAVHYGDRFVGMLCPAAGGLIGYLIEQEYESKG